MRTNVFFTALSGMVFLSVSGILSAAQPQQKTQESLKDLAYAEQVYGNSKSGKSLRRRAFLRLLEQEKQFDAVALRGMKDPDPAIRRYALSSYLTRKGDQGAGILKTMASEKDPVTAEYILWCSKRIRTKELQLAIWKELSTKSPLPEIRTKAKRFASFNFFRKKVRLQDDPTWDHEVFLVKSTPLPRNNWRFRLDPWEDGHNRGYFKTAFDDTNWKKISIADSWEKQGYPGYDGIAWYRFKFTAPSKGDANAAELFFQGVDEAAWVWLNGKYVGQRDLGPSGWNKVFYLDISKEILWGKENVLTVRVEDSIASGGIWKDVFLHILK